MRSLWISSRIRLLSASRRMSQSWSQLIHQLVKLLSQNMPSPSLWKTNSASFTLRLLKLCPIRSTESWRRSLKMSVLWLVMWLSTRQLLAWSWLQRSWEVCSIMEARWRARWPGLSSMKFIIWETKSVVLFGKKLLSCFQEMSSTFSCLLLFPTRENLPNGLSRLKANPAQLSTLTSDRPHCSITCSHRAPKAFTLW